MEISGTFEPAAKPTGGIRGKRMDTFEMRNYR